jgi:3'-5' exoribonuclease
VQLSLGAEVNLDLGLAGSCGITFHSLLGYAPQPGLAHCWSYSSRPGKIEALELAGVRFVYAARGQLIEHVTLGLEILEKHVGRFPGFPLELKTILQHFVVSHHGDLDKGALRRPMLPEAFALSLLDLMTRD